MVGKSGIPGPAEPRQGTSQKADKATADPKKGRGKDAASASAAAATNGVADNTTRGAKPNAPTPDGNGPAKPDGKGAGKGGKAAANSPDQAASKAKPMQSSKDSGNGPVVVGVGASAGGLEALMHLLDALPRHANVAVIVVQHLEPHHRSRLAELLGKNSPMPVQEATEGTRVEANHVYVIPPNADLAIKEGRLVILERSEGQSRLAVIDKFFASLALEVGTRSMGVILSGTGSDGAAGLKEIKEAGGITFAQEPESAAYRGMPDAAVRAGVVDFILKPAQIATEIVQLLKHPYVAPANTLDEQMEQDIPNLDKVHILLRNATGVDFADYKMSTFKRRLLRRMALHDVRDLATYIEQLRADRQELQALYSDALISVTGFFREPQTFQALSDEILPKLSKSRDRTIRIWIAGCSTGEEVYSMAITVLEAFGEAAATRTIQFFATDINEANVTAARQGLYKEAAVTNIPEVLLKRYFSASGDGYQVSKRLRDMCVFSVHNVYRDPPFSNVDIVSCRNVLIYFRQEAQKRALTAFHYALRTNGTLVLGSSESTGQLGEYFTQSDTHTPIYTRKDKALPLSYAIFRTPIESGRRPVRQMPVPEKNEATLRQRINTALLGAYVPPGVVSDRLGEVIEFIGHTRDFLEPAPGRATLNVFRMARPGLELDVRAVVMQAQHEHKRAIRRVRWKQPGGITVIEIECIPLTDLDGEEMYAVTFHRTGQETPHGAPKDEASQTSTLDALEEELEQTREQLQSTVEQYETTTEELRTSNEEALSINEELQSTNEELQTTAEELQSANEELSTLNEELSNRNTELSRVNSDLENLLSSVRFPIVFLGSDLCIRRFTPAAQKSLRLIGSDVGRPIGDLRLRLGVDNLEDMVQSVIDTVQPIEREVRDESGWSLLRIQPYRTSDNRIDGAVLVVIDITDVKRTRDELVRSNQDLQQFAAFTSHELRAPLRNAKLYLGMADRKLSEGKLDKAREELTTTSESLDRMMRLINALLRFSEVSDSKANHKKVDLEQAVSTAAAMLGISADGAKAKIELQKPLAPVWADETLLGIVLTNLLTNAMHHSDHAPTITISVDEREDDVEVSVKDDGPGLRGIDPSTVFELFNRGTSNNDGIGLGLAITRRIIEAHGGSIRVDSAKTGTDIRFTLPVVRDRAVGHA